MDKIEKANLADARSIVKEDGFDGGYLLICNSIYSACQALNLTPTEARILGYYAIEELQKRMDKVFTQYDMIFPRCGK